MINRNTTMCIFRSFAQNRPRNTERGVCDVATSCPTSTHGHQHRQDSCRVQPDFSCHVDGHQREARVWQVVNQPLRKGMEHMGIHMSPDPGWTLWIWGWERKSGRPGFPPGPAAAGNRLWDSVCTTSGSIMDVETRCDLLASKQPPSCSLSLRRPPASLQDHLTPICTRRALLSDGRREGRQWSHQFSLPDTAPCICTRASLLEWMTLLFLWCDSKGCTIYQKCFLITSTYELNLNQLSSGWIL